MLSWQVGDEVEAKWSGDKHYYPGRIGKKFENGTFEIQFDDGEVEAHVLPSNIRNRKMGSSESEEDASNDEENSEAYDSYAETLQKLSLRRSRRARKAVKTYLEEANNNVSHTSGGKNRNLSSSSEQESNSGVSMFKFTTNKLYYRL